MERMEISAVVEESWHATRCACACTCAQVFMAEPFNAEVDRLEATGRKGASAMQAPAAVLPSSVPREGQPGFRRYVQLRRINWTGSTIMAIYLTCALLLHVRARHQDARPGQVSPRPLASGFQDLPFALLIPWCMTLLAAVI